MEKEANKSEIKHKEYYTCKRLRLLKYLVNKGFKPVATLPDANNPRYNWWLFKNTPDFEKAINHYFNKIN